MDAGVYSLWPDYGIDAGQVFHAGMDYKMHGTINGTCTLRVEFDPLISFVSASITPDVVESTYIEWFFTNPATPYWNCMSMFFELDSSAVAGQIMNWEASFSCTTSDVCPGNDVVTRITEVLSGPLKTQATDSAPISIIVLHTGNQLNGDITHDDSTFSYMINFQNLTSDTAFHIRIIDHLSPHLDIRTLSQPFSMLPYKLYIPDDQTIIWEFDNVAMPDTGSSYIESYSFVQYNIRMKQNLPFGTQIENHAWVYFNREDSTMTNITSNTIVDPDGIVDASGEDAILQIFPNPANGTFSVAFNYDNPGRYSVELKNVLGQLVFARSFEHDIYTDISIDQDLEAGIYLVTIVGNGNAYAGKLVME